ncbi:MAG: hypothetical protein LBE35_02870 [Clostridiales bacterium]|nr:hypothetical protein [Clostridiales bacterium]
MGGPAPLISFAPFMAVGRAAGLRLREPMAKYGRIMIPPISVILRLPTVMPGLTRHPLPLVGDSRFRGNDGITGGFPLSRE